MNRYGYTIVVLDERSNVKYCFTWRTLGEALYYLSKCAGTVIAEKLAGHEMIRQVQNAGSVGARKAGFEFCKLIVDRKFYVGDNNVGGEKFMPIFMILVKWEGGGKYDPSKY